MTQGWGSNAPQYGGGADDGMTRGFAPVSPDSTQYNPFQDGQSGQVDQTGQSAWAPTGPGDGGGAGGNGGRGAKIAIIVLVVLLVIAVGVILATQWNNLVGGDDDSSASPATTTMVLPADGSGSSGQDSSSSASRPTTPNLPSGVTAVNAAAINNEPTGNFNSVWLSGPTTPGFAENVRNAYVNAYLSNRKTDQTVTASSPSTRRTYTMTCVDKTSYIHCTGGNNANVYIA